MILNSYEDKKININYLLDGYLKTKPKNDQGKSYKDQTNKETDKEKERQTLRIII